MTIREFQRGGTPLLPINYDILPNGSEMLVCADHRAEVSALQVWVKVGCGHETKEQSGMAHFIEHMLFKGTERHAGAELGQIIEGCGGYVNAYTNYDHTVFHINLPAAHTMRGLELLHDAVYHSTLREEDIATEKEVIIEEMREYADDPASVIREEAIHRAFGGKVHPILGLSQEAIRGYTAEDLHTFYNRHYVPRNVAVVAVGDFVSREVAARIAKLFGEGIDPIFTSPAPTRVFRTEVQAHVLRGDYQKPRVLLALPAPQQGNIDTFSFDCAAFVLGCGDTSRLNLQLRDRARLVSTITAAVTTTVQWGLLEVGALAEADEIPEVVAEIGKMLRALSDAEPPTVAELERAVINARVDYAHQIETAEGLAENLGFSLTTPQKHLYAENYFTQLEKVSPAEVRGAWRRWLNFKQATIICAVPSESKVVEKSLCAAFCDVSRGVAKGVKRARGKEKPSGLARETFSKTELKAGVDFLYRRCAHGNLANLVAVTRGGLAGETAKTNGMYNAFANLLGQATAAHTHLELTALIEGRGASISGFSGKDALGVQLQCLAEDLPRFARILMQCIVEPRFPEEQWRTVAAEIGDTFSLQMEHPSSFCMQKYREQIFAGHPYSFPVCGMDISAFTAESLASSFAEARARGAWVIAATSPFPNAEVRDLLWSACEEFTPRETHTAVAKTKELSKGGAFIFEKDREQSHIAVGYTGVAWDDPDRAALDVLLSVLGGQGGRLFLNLREERGLAYTVAPILSFGLGGGTFGGYISCAPDKMEEAHTALMAELQFTSALPTEDEVVRTKQFAIGNFQLEMAGAEKQLSHIALMEVLGVGYKDLEIYPRALNEVTRRDVERVIERLIVDRPHVSVTVSNT